MKPAFYTIQIPTDKLGIFVFAIYAQTFDGIFNISSMLTVTIIPVPEDDSLKSLTNMAPFFASEPSSASLYLNAFEQEVSLPEILDSHENFCTIEIESSTLGSTFYTNSSDETPANDMISYDIGSNTIGIRLPSDRV